MTVTVKEAPLLVPPNVQRRAGFKMGDRLEFKVSRGVVTIVAKQQAVEDDEYTQEQRQIIDAKLAESDEDVKAGRVYGPFSAKEAATFLRKELKARAKRPE